MKTDRLYAITLHLLNHGKTTAAELARKLEVSVRTIQRDVDSLCRSGVPVIAETGVNGGYYLSDSFRMNAQLATDADYSNILTALKGFSTAMDDPQISAAAEKIAALTSKREDGVVLDFSVLQEVDSCLMHALQAAIRRRKAVRFGYTNANNEWRLHTAEPVAVVYQWYAWYLLAYSVEKGDYRVYKLVRIDGLEMTDMDFSRTHEGAEAILRENRQKEGRKTTEIKVRCRPEARAKAIEYLNGWITAEADEGGCEMTLKVIEEEHFWLGTILSLGDGIEIREPERIRRRVMEAAEKIVKLYEKL